MQFLGSSVLRVCGSKIQARMTKEAIAVAGRLYKKYTRRRVENEQLCLHATLRSLHIELPATVPPTHDALHSQTVMMSQTTSRMARRSLQQLSHSRLPKHTTATPAFVVRRTLTVSARSSVVGIASSSSVRSTFGARLTRGNFRTPVFQQSKYRYWRHHPLLVH